MEYSYISTFFNWLTATYELTLVIVVAAFCYILQAIGKFFVFKKAGKTPWHGFIPILSDWHQLDLSWNRMIAWLWVGLVALSCLFLTGVINAIFHFKPYIHDALMIVVLITVLIIMVIDCYQLAKAFGKNFFFVLGLFFLFPIFMLILGMDKSKYLGPQE